MIGGCGSKAWWMPRLPLPHLPPLSLVVVLLQAAGVAVTMISSPLPPTHTHTQEWRGSKQDAIMTRWLQAGKQTHSHWSPASEENMVSVGFSFSGMRGWREGGVGGWMEECLGMTAASVAWWEGGQRGDTEEGRRKQGWTDCRMSEDGGWTREGRKAQTDLPQLWSRYKCVCVCVILGLHALHVSILSAKSNRRYVTFLQLLYVGVCSCITGPAPLHEVTDIISCWKFLVKSDGTRSQRKTKWLKM